MMLVARFLVTDVMARRQCREAMGDAMLAAESLCRGAIRNSSEARTSFLDYDPSIDTLFGKTGSCKCCLLRAKHASGSKWKQTSTQTDVEHAAGCMPSTQQREERRRKRHPSKHFDSARESRQMKELLAECQAASDKLRNEQKRAIS